MQLHSIRARSPLECHLSDANPSGITVIDVECRMALTVIMRGA
jgi:hypothetical protein